VRNSGKKLRVGATSLTTGEYRVFTEQDEPLAAIVYASAAYPVAFEPARIFGEWWIDGGVRTVTPIRACIDAGCTDIDVVMLAPDKTSPSFDPDPTVVDIVLRSLEVQADEIIANDLRGALLWNRLIRCGADTEKRVINFTVVRPQDALPTRLLRFEPRNVELLIRLGHRDATEALR